MENDSLSDQKPESRELFGKQCWGREPGVLMSCWRLSANSSEIKNSVIKMPLHPHLLVFPLGTLTSPHSAYQGKFPHISRRGKESILKYTGAHCSS